MEQNNSINGNASASFNGIAPNSSSINGNASASFNGNAPNFASFNGNASNWASFNGNEPNFDSFNVNAPNLAVNGNAPDSNHILNHMLFRLIRGQEELTRIANHLTREVGSLNSNQVLLNSNQVLLSNNQERLIRIQENQSLILSGLGISEPIQELNEPDLDYEQRVELFRSLDQRNSNFFRYLKKKKFIF